MRSLSSVAVLAAAAAAGVAVLLPDAVSALNHFEGWHPVPASRVADLPYGYVEDDAGVKKKKGGDAAEQLQERIDVVPGDDDGPEKDGAPRQEEEEPFFVTHGDNKVIRNYNSPKASKSVHILKRSIFLRECFLLISVLFTPVETLGESLAISPPN